MGLTQEVQREAKGMLAYKHTAPDVVLTCIAFYKIQGINTLSNTPN